MPDPLADLARLEGVPSAVAAARDTIDVVLRDRGLRVIAPEETVEALLAGARASAQLSEEPQRWLPGSIRLATELLALSGLVHSAPGQVLARAHALVVTGAVAPDSAGRLRSSAEVADRMTTLGRLLTAPTSAPAMLVAAVAHGEVAALQPFGTADDVVARALEHMVLITSGVDPGGVVLSEAGHLGRADDYPRLLQRYAEGTLGGVRAWVLHCLAAYGDGAALSPVGRGKGRHRRGQPRRT